MSLPLNQIIQGDCVEVMRGFPKESIDLVMFSPPYWGLRDYGVEVSKVWGGDKDCEHEWGETAPPPRKRSKKDVKNPNSLEAKKRGLSSCWESKDVVSNFCVKCGAWKGQLGLEPHPNQWISHMVDVCRGVKRVLKKSGSLYLNVGDTYFGGRSMIKSNGFSLKETDRAWLGALIDCEGCIYVHKRSKGRKNATYGVGISVGNTKKELLEKAKNIVGVGSIACYPQPKRRRKPIYRWVVMANEAKQVLRTIYPYLIAKRLQAKACLSLPSNGPIAKDIHKKVKLLNQGMAKVEDEWAEPKIETINPDWGKALQPKQLLGMPWRLAIALQEDGWILRNAVIWFKKNHMPSSVKDRLTCAYEHIFHFVKARKYFYDLDAIRQPHRTSTIKREKYGHGPTKSNGSTMRGLSKYAKNGANLNPLGKNPSDIINHDVAYHGDLHHYRNEDTIFGKNRGKEGNIKGKNPSDIIKIGSHHGSSLTKGRATHYEGYPIESDPKGKNPSDFWSINTKPFPQAHFAVYPEAVCEMPIKSSCPHAVCKKCGKPKTRISETSYVPHRKAKNLSHTRAKSIGPKHCAMDSRGVVCLAKHETVGWSDCGCNKGFDGGIVLDPMCGAGTTLVVAQKLGRRWIGIDLKAEYVEMAKKRLMRECSQKLTKFLEVSD